MKTLRIGLVAAEPSGDLLASGLMAAIKARLSGVSFEGIGGDRMIAEGMDSWVPLDELSVMGVIEVLKQLPALLKIRRNLVSRWKKDPPDLFIGIDAPDFNLELEIKLHKLGVPTVHYVCPTVWAWRSGRVHKVKRAADLVLSIFPFEEKLLHRHSIPARYVGHPLAADYPLQVDRAAAREALQIEANVPVLAILPGSRANEVRLVSEPFLKTALACKEKIPELRLVSPVVSAKTRDLYQQAVDEFAPGLEIKIVEADTRIALSAADVALVTSGTATLESLLCKCPMVVGYRANPVSYKLVTGLNLVKTRYVAMSNILAGEGLAPEYIQDECTPEKLIPAVMRWFEEPQAAEQVRQRYHDIHAGMKLETNSLAADAVIELLDIS